MSLKVSCIMPTSGRRRFVPTAVASFLAQTYENRQLVVVDECAEDSIADLIPKDPRIVYHRLKDNPERTIGDLRNIACDLANGDLIAHWDDDDKSLPERLAAQVEAFHSVQCDLVGFSQMYFVDQRKSSNDVWLYSADRADYVIGTSFLYRRAFWYGHRFQKRDTGEDNHFFDDDEDPNPPKLLQISGLGLMVARIHRASTSAHHLAGTCWSPVEDPTVAAWAREQLPVPEL